MDDRQAALINGLHKVIEVFADAGIEAAELDDAWQTALMLRFPDHERVPDAVWQKLLFETAERFTKQGVELGMLHASTRGPGETMQ